MPTRKNTTLSAIPLSHPINKNIALELQLITPDLAAAWLGDNHGNRNQRPRAIAAYTRDILNGEWLTTGESIKFDWNGRLIDGQHRLEAVIASKKSITSVVVHGLDPRVQRVLDTNAKRTAADALRFAGVTVQPKDVASIARVAIAFESGKIRTALDQAKVDVTHAETIAWHDANPDVINAAALATRVARPIGATISGIGYAVLALERIDGLAAVEFFTSMAEKRGLTGNGDPRKAMLDAFDSIRSHRRVPTAAESLAITFRAWNVWRADGTLKIIRAGASDGNGGTTGVLIPEPK
jgi:hypothetical protein